MTHREHRAIGNLPAAVTSLIGRRAEAAEVRRLLGEARVVTLTGPGGVGKTRLALEVARRASAAFAGGVWLVPLAEVTRPDLVIPTIVSTFGSVTRHRELTDLIGDQQILLVIDNCEHLAQECAEVTSSMVAECPGLTVLATSREPLRLEGEALFAVRPLSVPRFGGPEVPGAARSRDAVDLFVERAKLVNPDFALDVDTERLVVELCRRLDGLPLAIELAAAATRVLPLDAVSGMDEEPMSASVRGFRAGPARHQSLTATIECSYQLCSEPARRLWERMSVFRGGAVLDAVGRVCADGALSKGEIVAALVELTDKSVVEFDGARYRMLETIRHFGSERLTAADLETSARLAHLQYVAGLADEVDRGWYAGEQQALVRRAGDEQANVRAALSFTLEDPDRVELGLRIAHKLYGLWLTAGSLGEGRHWLERLLNADNGSSERAPALWVAGLVSALDGEAPAAELLFEEGIARSRQLEDHANLAHALQGLGFCHVLQGKTEDALAVLEEAVRLERGLQSPNPHLGRALTTLGIALCAADRSHHAARVLEEARSLQVAGGDEFMGSWSEIFLGLAACLDRRLTHAENLLTRVLKRKRALGDSLGISFAVEFLAWVAIEGGDAKRAARLLGASEALARLIGPHLVGFSRFMEWHDHYAERARVLLGDRYYDATMQRAGRATVDDTIAFALGEEPTLERAHDQADQRPTLTQREWQIAGLVAEGKTNKEIAAELVIGQRTVDSHVAHIFSKLGVTSRARVAAIYATLPRA